MNWSTVNSRIIGLRQDLAKGQYSLGSWLQIPSVVSAGIMAQNKFDWIVVDQEHGSISGSELQGMCQAIRGRSCLPFVRVAEPDPRLGKLALEAGAVGLIIPNLTSAAEFKLFANSCLYPPHGARGVGFSAGNDYGTALSTQLDSDWKPFLVPMIENKRIVKNLSDLLNQPYLDAIFIGPYDLSASLGVTGQFDNKVFIKILENVRHKAAEASIPVGIHVVSPSVQQVRQRIEEGFKFIAYSLDTVLLDVSDVLEQIRS